ncbi:uncharacterized protein LOC126837175 [Adelges cooleyi]|uniref:uncharacterized protein LOC126837175 n=1 Tax=Adelges cooleyi TaxID=133065 RepID=UPI0021808A03|nr:uncharacterized protein LOC126837175 [Adelges cooleyi]
MEKCAVVEGAVSNFGDRRRPDLTGSSCSEVKKSRLATPEDWERYQQQIIQSCFDCWEADNELDEPNTDEQAADGKAENTDDGAEQECTGPANESPTQRFRSAEVSYGWVDDEFVKSPAAGMDKRKKFPRRKSKRFSFYKYTSRLIRERRQYPSQPQPSQSSPPLTPSQPADNYTQNGTLQSRCSAEDWWQCKKWLDTVEKIPDPPPPPLGLRSEYPFVCPSPAVTVAGHERQAKRRVRKFIDQIKDRSDRSSFGDRPRTTAGGCGTSDKLKRFFKNAFRKNRTDLDPQLLAQSIEYAGQELDKWRTLLHCLEDIKRSRENTKSLAAAEDTIKDKFSEINYTENQRARDDESADDDKSDGSGEAVAAGTTAPKSITPDETLDRANRLDDAECFARLERANWSTDNELQRSARRSLSDTDLPAMALDYERAFGSKIVRISRKTLMPNSGNDGSEYPTDDADAYGRWGGVARDLWKEHRECFRTAVARLEFVGSTFKEQYRLTGLKTLCKVDALAGFGRSAEAVDLFVSVLSLSKNPDLMVRKAEAVYDWKFFCHLCMWRHSYKD